MLQRFFALFGKDSATKHHEASSTGAVAGSLPKRNLEQALRSQRGSDVSIPKVPALSSALYDYFHDKATPHTDSVLELLTFCTPAVLNQISDNIGSLGSRGVALQSSSCFFFRFGSPALARYLKNFGIDLKDDAATDFLLNLGRATAYTLLQLPPHSIDVVDLSKYPSSAPALSRLLRIAATSSNVLTPNGMENLIRRADSPLSDSEFCEQIAYEVESLIDTSSSSTPHWRFEEAAMRSFARRAGPVDFIDPYSCLQTLHDAVQVRLGRGTKVIVAPSYHERVTIARQAVELFFNSTDSSVLLSDQIKISSGEVKNAED